MKKRMVCVLLTLLVSISLTACGTKETGEQNIEPAVEESAVTQEIQEETGENTEETEEPEEAETSDESPIEITGTELEQLYDLTIALADYAPTKEEVGKVSVDEWLDYILLSQPVSELGNVEQITETVDIDLLDGLKAMSVQDKPIYAMSAYDVMWIMKHVFRTDAYTIADLNAIETRKGKDFFINCDRDVVSKYWANENHGRYADYEKSITTVFIDTNEITLKMAFLDDNEEEISDPFYIHAHLEEKDGKLYWAFDYWGYDLSYLSRKPPQPIEADWKEAYREFLLNYESEFDLVEPRFNLAYIDEDDIPELIIMDDDFHAASGDVYMYYEGEVVFIHSYGTYGGFPFVTKGNYIMSGGTGMGEAYASYHKIEDGKDVSLITLRGAADWSEEELDPEEDYYFINEKPVTKAEYEKQSALYYDGKEFFSIWYNWSYEINEETVATAF
ncbi:MAG: hypothetical protein J1E61_01700 [Lachnospiraceae bacterium]|nr:hypothetical protein [Lachnospiraceae bacterium]